VRVATRAVGPDLVKPGAGHGRAAALQVPEWTLEPSGFEVGGDVSDPRYVLSGVVGATRLPDGRVVLADRFAQGLRVYDADGAYVERVGREGEGPGEYEAIRGIGPCEDGRLVAFDITWERKVYDLELNLLDERGPEVPGLGLAFDLACTPSGEMVAIGWGLPPGRPPIGLHTTIAPVVIAREEGVVRVLGDRLSSERIGGRGGSGPRPFGRRTTVAIGGGLVYLGDGSDYLVEVFGPDGAPRPPVRWEGPSRQITREHLEAYQNEVVPGASRPALRAYRRMLRDYPPPDVFPAYDALRTDPSGRLWVRHFPRPGRPRVEWVVLGRGTLVGRVEVDRGTELLEIGDEHVIVVEHDALEVETVRVMTIVR